MSGEPAIGHTAAVAAVGMDAARFAAPRVNTNAGMNFMPDGRDGIM